MEATQKPPITFNSLFRHHWSIHSNRKILGSRDAHWFLANHSKKCEGSKKEIGDQARQNISGKEVSFVVSWTAGGSGTGEMREGAGWIHSFCKLTLWVHAREGESRHLLQGWMKSKSKRKEESPDQDRRIRESKSKSLETSD